MADDVQTADDEARLLVEAFALGDETWEAYIAGWKHDVKRRIAERWPNAPSGNSGPPSGIGADLDSPAVNSGAAP